MAILVVLRVQVGLRVGRRKSSFQATLILLFSGCTVAAAALAVCVLETSLHVLLRVSLQVTHCGTVLLGDNSDKAVSPCSCLPCSLSFQGSTSRVPKYVVTVVSLFLCRFSTAAGPLGLKKKRIWESGEVHSEQRQSSHRLRTALFLSPCSLVHRCGSSHIWVWFLSPPNSCDFNFAT